MKQSIAFLSIALMFVVACQPVEIVNPSVNEEPETIEEVIQKVEIVKEKSSPKEFRLEIPTELERGSLPECDMDFTNYPVDIEDLTSITPLGNLGPPGHTFPTDHPHLHLGERDSNELYNVYAPADVYLTLISWGDGMTEDPRDYVIYFSLCKDVIAYYNHIKTVSPQIQDIIDKYSCEDFSQGKEGCTKVINLEKINAGSIMGSVGLKQGNFDFGLIDLREKLDFVKPDRYPQRTQHIQCVFEYYPTEMRDVLYNLINRDDGTCGGIMQDVEGTLQGNWFHESSPKENVVLWDVFLAFVEHFEYANVQVVSIAGKFTNPSLFHFKPRDDGNINRDFSQVVPGEVYCYQSEDVGYVNQRGAGKIILKMADEETLHIEHERGSCKGNEILTDFEVYYR